MDHKSYQICQNRYEPGCQNFTHDEYPFLFPSIEEARARVKRDGLAAMFEHEGDIHYIAELVSYPDGFSYTGLTFKLEA